MDSLIWVIAVTVGLALIAGLFANRLVRPFAKSEVQGVKLEALVGPIVSITVLLLAFTLVTVFGSYQRGQTAASDEARKVDHQFEMALYLNEPERQGVAAATACYAAAVANYEWDAMADGKTAAEVSTWTRMMKDNYAPALANDENTSTVLGGLMTSDRDRGEARSRRLTEARPAVPIELKALLVFTAATGIFALATFTLPNVRRRVQIGVLIALSTVFVLFLGVIAEMDRPYDGAMMVDPVDITRVAGDLSEEYQEAYPGTPLPCDDTGRELP